MTGIDVKSCYHGASSVHRVGCGKALHLCLDEARSRSLRADDLGVGSFCFARLKVPAATGAQHPNVAKLEDVVRSHRLAFDRYGKLDVFSHAVSVRFQA